MYIPSRTDAYLSKREEIDHALETLALFVCSPAGPPASAIPDRLGGYRLYMYADT
jgi:hypothetical protein